MQNIDIRIENEELWKEFYPETEMIVTKKGRALFPKLDFRVTGLVPDAFYAFQIHFERVDDMRYKFDKGVWETRAKEEIQKVDKVLRHSDGFKSGEEWMQHLVQFPRLKITNNPLTIEPTHFVLQTMCKYVPVLTVVQMEPMSFNTPLDPPPYQEEFPFDIAQFIAVTAYQNREITQLKVQHNKYARGFRTAGDLRRKRAASPSEPKMGSTSTSPKDMAYLNPAKRAPYPARPYYPAQFMQYNTEMPNFYYPPEMFPGYNTYPSMTTAAYQQMSGEHAAYNAAASSSYWPMMPSSTTFEQSPDSSVYSATCQSTSSP